MSAPVEITGDVIEAVGSPFVAFTALGLLAAQCEELGTWDAEILEGLLRWPANSRALALRDFHRYAEVVRDFGRDALEQIEAMEADE